MALLVQSNSGSATSASSLTVTLGSGTTAGNCLAVCIGALGSSTTESVSGVTLGGAAGNFASAASKLESGSSIYALSAIWVDQNCAGGQTSVAVTFSASDTFVTAFAMEWSGILASGAVDQAVSAGTTTTSWSSGTTGTLAQPVEVAIGAVSCYTGTTLSITGPSSPWTNFSPLYDSAYGSMAGYQILSATTGLAYSGTQNGSISETNAACIVTLKCTPGLLVPPVNINQAVMRASTW